jgi:hypothetical protein
MCIHNSGSKPVDRGVGGVLTFLHLSNAARFALEEMCHSFPLRRQRKNMMSSHKIWWGCSE